MAESSVIREFLVALGFKTDEAALKKFDAGIERATKTVFGLAAAIETTAVVVSAGVARWASNLEALYFASIKAHSSAINLKAFDRAAQNLGTNAGEALQSVQGLARALRENPGNEGYLDGLLGKVGEGTRDAKGHLRDTTDLMLGLSKFLSTQQYYMAKQYAGIFGISEDTLRAMRSPGFASEVTRMREQMKNSGFDQSAKDAHRFMSTLRDLQTYLEAFGIKVYDALVKKLGGGMGSLTEWLQKKGPLLAERMADVLVKIIDVAERIIPVVAWLVNKFIEWDKATDGWSTRLLGLLAVLKLFGGAQIIGGILTLAGAFLNLGRGMLSASAAGPGLLGLLSRLGLVAAAGAGGYWLGGKIYENLSDNLQDKIGKAAAVVAGVLGSKTAKEAIATNDPMTYLRLNGWGKDQAAGIVANLQAESGMNPQAVGDHGKAYGLGQWHADRQAAFAKWSGHDIHQSSAAEQLDFIDFELKRGAEQKAGALLRAALNARQSAEIVSRYYERPAAADAEAAKRGAAAVQLSQETTIHIHGSSDPAASGREVAGAQNRVNAEVVRNMQGAVR